ncbi:hypothetical protein ACFX13_020534 [Malus domestica]|uniref:uncharacterized protein n=1 Tax=Malus domestica TaxID=3750 RepID=UPI0010AB1E0D|nr:uncharacterized protein LOC103425368 [Malus domestica]XP_028949674.1 uncharacterized protein LOC103425368 [Malus domestica]XP_050125381.1 uncharacterized protein LOC126602525 [Malus sylvestris]
MRTKQPCRGRGRPRKTPNVVSERVVSERVVSERVVNENENAFLNFVNHNTHNVEEGNILECYESSREDRDDEEFNPEMEIDSASNSTSIGSDWSGGDQDGDQDVSSVDKAVQKLLKYVEESRQREKSSKKIGRAQTKQLTGLGSWSRFPNEEEAPSHNRPQTKALTGTGSWSRSRNEQEAPSHNPAQTKALTGLGSWSISRDDQEAPSHNRAQNKALTSLGSWNRFSSEQGAPSHNPVQTTPLPGLGSSSRFRNGQETPSHDRAETTPLAGLSSWISFENQQEAPSHVPHFNKKELSASLAVIKRVMEMDASVPFNTPVDPVAMRMPDYFDVIDTPMDFGTICNHLQNGTKYMNSEDVFRDVQYIWKNCCTYYNEGNFVLDLMKRVKEKFMTYWTEAGLCSKEPGPRSVLKSSNVEKRRTRGPTVNRILDQVPFGGRLEVTWRNRRAVGESSKLFKSACTALVRQTREIPLQVKSWKSIPIDIKKKAFERILKRFKVEDHMRWVLEQIHRSYHSYRRYLKRLWYDTCGTIEEARQNIPPSVAEDDWQYLTDLWSSPEWKAWSKKNKENGFKENNLIHTCGSKSFSQIYEEERKKTGNDPGRIRLWELTHLRSDGKAAHPAAEEALSKLKALYAEVSAGNLHMTEDEIYEKVFGPERPQRERGITSKELWGELRKQLDESKQRQEESEQRCVAEVQGLKEQLGRVEGLFSEQMNRFEGLLVQLASQVSSPVQTERPTVNPPSQRGRPRTVRPRR